jgi:hypothetical protein
MNYFSIVEKGRSSEHLQLGIIGSKSHFWHWTQGGLQSVPANGTLNDTGVWTQSAIGNSFLKESQWSVWSVQRESIAAHLDVTIIVFVLQKTQVPRWAVKKTNSSLQPKPMLCWQKNYFLLQSCILVELFLESIFSAMHPSKYISPSHVSMLPRPWNV